MSVTGEHRIEHVALDDIAKAERNPKLHATDTIQASVKEHGVIELPTINETTGRLVAGHGRIEALQAMRDAGEQPPGFVRVRDDGVWEVPVMRGLSWADDAAAERYLLVSNRAVEQGGWNNEQLDELLRDVASEDLAAVGFTDDDLRKLIAKPPAPVGDGRTREKKPPAPALVPADADVQLIEGCCIEKMAELDDASVDAIVTDPPYELGFMGKQWDASGIAYNADVWREALRVLKPGGHLLAFGGTRTYHRMVCAIEDVGFEVRDSLHWIYGTGFPKSHDVSKAVDGDEAKQWNGWGTALKPAHEPIVVARKPLDGTVAETVLAHGTGALNADACRVGDEKITIRGDGNVWVEAGRKGNPAQHFDRVGRWPPNILFVHADDCTDDACADGCPVAALGDEPAQFFPCFRYEAKATRGERAAGLDDDNTHPTVKPVELMRWLVRLVTPPGGTVLDPFMGSGTTGIAAAIERFAFIGIEKEPDHVRIARGRLNQTGDE